MGSLTSAEPRSLSMAAKEIWKAVAMADHFEKIQKLPDPVPGCPNFRRVPGYKVYCCGQPTVAGFKAALEKVCGTIYPKDGKIIWVNMRQEPNVYINGEPVCARPPNKIGEYAELGDVNRDKVKEDELEFAKVLENRAADAEGKVKVVDINKVEKEVELKEIVTLSSVIEGLKEDFPGLHHMRIPVCNSASPTEADFDILKSKIMDNIHKYYYLIAFTAFMREAAELARNAATEEAKANALTGGKVSQPADQLKVSKTFVAWMEDHKELRSIVEEGKGKLQWERDIPAAALANLESLASNDFKANLGRIIHDIYQTAHTMFADMPQGDHKKRAKYRFASKTLMRILPAALKTEVEGLIEKKTITLDLYEILGQCTWGQGPKEA